MIVQPVLEPVDRFAALVRSIDIILEPSWMSGSGQLFIQTESVLIGSKVIAVRSRFICPIYDI